MENDKNFNLDFIGIGSGKSGSTWLYKCLIEHPEICDYNPKEINYFSYLFDSHNKEWYFKQFQGCGALIKGEFSVSYMEDPAVAERIKELFPSIKLIVILRNPVDKIFSNFRHSIRKGEIQPELSFMDYIKKKDHLAPGLYARQLEPYFRIFDPANIYLIVLEEFNQNIIRNILNLYSFIGVQDPQFMPKSLEKKINQSVDYNILMIENLITKTSKFLNRKGCTLLIEHLKKLGFPDLIRKINRKKDQTELKIDWATKQKLIDYFRVYNSQFEELIGRPIQVWRTN